VSRSDDRHTEKLHQRDQTRRRREARDHARNERDAKLHAINERRIPRKAGHLVRLARTQSVNRRTPHLNDQLGRVPVREVDDLELVLGRRHEAVADLVLERVAREVPGWPPIRKAQPVADPAHSTRTVEPVAERDELAAMPKVRDVPRRSEEHVPLGVVRFDHRPLAGGESVFEPVGKLACVREAWRRGDLPKLFDQRLELMDIEPGSDLRGDEIDVHPTQIRTSREALSRIEHGVGVTDRARYLFSSIDEDYFTA
jgi:hypothetical protein